MECSAALGMSFDEDLIKYVTNELRRIKQPVSQDVMDILFAIADIE